MDCSIPLPVREYELELQRLKPDDEVQETEENYFNIYPKIYTAGHGYLVVPINNQFIGIAKKIVDYGYTGKLAIYLEEDCEAWEFINKIKENFKIS